MMSARCLLPLAAVLAWIICPMAAGATVWTVEFDPNQPEDRIGQVVLQAGDGDTILVGPGTYFEHIHIPHRSLTLLSVAGADATVLDGSREITGRAGSILYSDLRGAGDLRISGFTLRGGTGTDTPWREAAGGAIFWEGDNAGSLVVADCVFRENRPERDFGGRGGAIFVGYLMEATIRSCSFFDNRADVGGAIALTYFSGPCTVQDCHFSIAGPRATYGDGTAVNADLLLDLVFEGNRIIGGNDGLGVVVVIWATCCRFARNFIAASERMPGGYVRLESYRGIGAENQEVDVSDNVFIGGEPWWRLQVDIEIPSGRIRVEGNTFIQSLLNCKGGSGAPMSVARNLFYETPTWLYANSGGAAECNCTWPSDLGISQGTLTAGPYVHADPLLCRRGPQDYTISESSPCADGNSPPGCGRIGAGEVACDAIVTRSVSWGTIRALFR